MLSTESAGIYPTQELHLQPRLRPWKPLLFPSLVLLAVETLGSPRDCPSTPQGHPTPQSLRRCLRPFLPLAGQLLKQHGLDRSYRAATLKKGLRRTVVPRYLDFIYQQKPQNRMCELPLCFTKDRSSTTTGQFSEKKDILTHLTQNTRYFHLAGSPQNKDSPCLHRLLSGKVHVVLVFLMWHGLMQDSKTGLS